jgi:hypothetical protein
VLGSTSLIADPTGLRCVILLRRQRAERHETANEQVNESNTAPDYPFLLLPPPCLSKCRDWEMFTMNAEHC